MMGRRNTPDLLASTLLEYPFAQPVRSRKRKAPRKSSNNDDQRDDSHGSSKEINDSRVTPAERPKSGYRIPGERRSKNILFYRNGDKFFKGKKVRITPHRYLTFTELLNDLTKSVSLPYGVRKVFTPEGQVIENIDDLQDGKAYVCASFERFKQLNYGGTSLPDWSSNTRKPTRLESKYPISRLSLGYSYPPTGKYAASYSKAQEHGGRSVPGSFTYNGPRSSGDASTRVFGKTSDPNGFKPRLVKFIKYGAKPRKVVSILLNKRTVFSFEHLLNEITDAFDLSVHKNQRIRKLYTTKGKEIRGVSDFFRETDSFFIATTSRQPLLKVEIQDILDELLPSNPNLTLEPAKPRRKFKDRDNKSDSGVEADGPGDTPTKSASAELPPLEHKKDGDELSGKIKIKAWATQEEREEDEKRIAAEEKRRKEEAIRRRKEEAEQKAKEEEEKRKEEEKRLQEEENKRKRREEELKVELARKEAELKAKEEELRRKEEEAKRRDEEEKKRKEEEKKKRERKKEEKRKKEEERKKRKEEEERKRKEEEERKSKEEEETKRKEEEERKRKEEEERKDKEKKEEERKRQEEEQKEEERRKKEKKRKEKEKKEEERKKKEEERKKKEEERKKEEEEQKKELEKLLNAKDDSIEPDSIEEQTVKDSKPQTDDDSDSRFDLPAEDSLVLSETSVVKLKQDNQKSDNGVKKDQESPEHTELTDDNKLENRFKPAPREIVHKNVVLEKYDVGKKIGDGNFAEVHKATLKSSGEAFAMKIVYKSKLKGKEHMIANEIGIMHNINHENIVRLYEEYETKNHIYLLMEFVSGGDLFDAITESIKFTEADGSQIIGDMARALQYLHDLNVVHRDLKPENLLVSKSSSGDIRVKLADFGLAMEVLEPIYTVCGTPTYVAPEILAESGYGLEVDMWATGVITYILLCGFPPFRSLDRDQEELFELIQAGQFEYLAPYWDNISFDAKDMINHLLVVNPKRRFKAHQILRHPWIMNHNKSQDLPNLQREVSMNLEKNFEGRRSAQGRVKESEH